MSNRKKAKKPWLGRRGKLIDERGLATKIEAPEEDPAQVIKEVPAIVHDDDGNKVEVGIAYIHDDGSVAIKFDEDAPEWAIDKIKGTAEEVGYNLVTGSPKES